MRKRLCVICLLTLITSCGVNTESTTQEVDDKTSAVESESQKNKSEEFDFTYSNLVDTASREEIISGLKKAGISQDRINSFILNVDDFNDTIKNTGLVTKGYKTLENTTPEYDIATNTELLENKYTEYLGSNCRMNTFSLLSDIIEIENPVVSDTSNLMFDLISLENAPREFLSEDEMEEFKSFFGAIPTPLTKDLSTHLKSVQNYWGERGVTFTNKGENSKISLISVFMHNAITEDESYLYIGHAGILLPVNNNKLIFIEKLSFQEPYQAIKFDNRKELVDYLMKKYDNEYGQPTARPFILENDELIEGFRYNPDNKG